MPLPDFIESPRFPIMLGWEYSVEPEYKVVIGERGTGYERRNLVAQYPKRIITVRIPQDRFADISYINRFHHAVRGRAIGFRVQDPTDYLSIELDGYEDVGRATAAADCNFTDQPLVESVSNPGSYQMIKRYSLVGDDDPLEQLLPIKKPVAGTIRVGNDNGVEQDPSTWDIDLTKGLITTATGFVGTPATWGGQFDLPMRFNSGLPIDVRDMRISEVSFVLKEYRPK